MKADQLALLENSKIIEPLSLSMRRNQSESGIPVALKFPYPYVSYLSVLELHNELCLVANSAALPGPPPFWRVLVQ